MWRHASSSTSRKTLIGSIARMRRHTSFLNARGLEAKYWCWECPLWSLSPICRSSPGSAATRHIIVESFLFMAMIRPLSTVERYRNENSGKP